MARLLKEDNLYVPSQVISFVHIHTYENSPELDFMDVPGGSKHVCTALEARSISRSERERKRNIAHMAEGSERIIQYRAWKLSRTEQGGEG
ncbi:uncharacterized protein RCO7_14799 [Rhynchosporium graminicola]|uniref:Uncharacterized protein n=1 Tax=Rhynchosporium graminicola TaxID=2792576 RepID=A0A1E1L5J1_9HELO|nr:uncharacterized protein RCO7_14799 [Rhynchosporium commune]